MIGGCQTKGRLLEAASSGQRGGQLALSCASYSPDLHLIGMEEVVILDRARISDYLVCPRRFQLRYLEHIPWPGRKADPRAERSRALGQRFHALLQRYFLGMVDEGHAEVEPELQRWWSLFRPFLRRIPSGRAIPEATLTVPIGGLRLTGRFDLLVVSDQAVHLFDWKTEGRPRTQQEMETDLQSRVYLALAAESGDALRKQLRPEHVTLTYWFATEPPVDISLTYDREEHAQQWSKLTAIATGIEERLGDPKPWPLTGDLSACGRCAFQILCGRDLGSPDLSQWADLEDGSSIEPALP